MWEIKDYSYKGNTNITYINTAPNGVISKVRIYMFESNYDRATDTRGVAHKQAIVITFINNAELIKFSKRFFKEIYFSIAIDDVEVVPKIEDPSASAAIQYEMPHIMWVSPIDANIVQAELPECSKHHTAHIVSSDHFKEDLELLDEFFVANGMEPSILEQIKAKMLFKQLTAMEKQFYFQLNSIIKHNAITEDGFHQLLGMACTITEGWPKQSNALWKLGNCCLKLELIEYAQQALSAIISNNVFFALANSVLFDTLSKKLSSTALDNPDELQKILFSSFESGVSSRSNNFLREITKQILSLDERQEREVFPLSSSIEDEKYPIQHMLNLLFYAKTLKAKLDLLEAERVNQPLLFLTKQSSSEEYKVPQVESQPVATNPNVKINSLKP